MRQSRYVFKITGMVSMAQYAGMPFGRQLDHRRAFEAFKAKAKSLHFSCKGKSTRAGVREFLKLYKPAEYFLIDHDGPMYHDDSFEVWYVEKETMLDKSVTELIEASYARKEC